MINFKQLRRVVYNNVWVLKDKIHKAVTLYNMYNLVLPF